eukprot:TRINITY_DN8979_c0_g1_i1.p1 TRINITY_DN8979_c0_g1~~TRINITY_DN8979_c0_g1_i1.p1  ORF type:complete len:435 (+),score=139.36 TRINITY_DN8979_c0_g1_i1:323-1627(+)
MNPLKKPNGIFGSSGNANEKEETLNHLRSIEAHLETLNAEYAQLKSEERDVGTEESRIKGERDRLQLQMKKREATMRKIATKEQTIQDLNTDEDTQAEEERLNAKLRTLSNRRYKLILEIKDIMTKLVTIAMQQNFIIVARLDMLNQHSKLHNQNHAAEQEFRAMRTKVNDLQLVYEEVGMAARAAKEKAQKEAPMTPELKAIFEEFPDELEEIEEAINEAQAKADLNHSGNNTVIEQYEKRKKEIEELEEKMATSTESLNRLKAEIESVKSAWLPPLSALVRRINESFSKHMSQIGCAGEVGLIEDEDYDKYSIQIKVKFRDEDPLQALNAHTQSGGERSVSTMLYLVSLQDLTPCPFRLVDEINQGMDPVNERMIFSVVAERACKPGLPQYFLITPKLLPDLNFTPEMTVLCIFNGPWQLPQKDWHPDKFLE